jgi:ABC-type branched-subunit amino acid transport system substrate-binding protein
MRGSRALAALAAIGALALASCSSGSSSANGSVANASPGLNGSTVKVGIFTNVGSGLSFASLGPAAQAAVAGINKRGGVAGHPLAVDECNAGQDPNLASQCARQFVSDKVAAVLGYTAVADASATPILAAAGIPTILGAPRTTQTLSSPFDFEFDAPAILEDAAAAAYAIKTLKLPTAILAAQSASASAFAQAVTGILKGFNIKTQGVVYASPTAADYSPIVATVQSMGAKALIVAVPAAQLGQFAKAAATSGGQFTYLGRTFYGASDTSAAAAATTLTVTAIPPLDLDATSGPMGLFVSDMKAAGQTLSYNANWFEGFSVWYAFYALQQVYKQTPGATNITPAGIVSTFNKAKNIDLGDGTDPWTPSLTSEPPLGKIAGTNRISNQGVFVIGQKNGKPYLLTPKPVNILDMLEGTGAA